MPPLSNNLNKDEVLINPIPCSMSKNAASVNILLPLWCLSWVSDCGVIIETSAN